MTADQTYSLLFSRLTWPSPIVRERAAVELAQLFADARIGSDVRIRYLRWLSGQDLESLCGMALLAPMRVKVRTGEEIFSAEELKAAIAFPSLQSFLFFHDCYPEHDIPVDFARLHSGTAPANFVSNPFFRKHATAFLPGIYELRSQGLEDAGCLGFLRQWGYEWEALCARSRVKISVHPLDFWLGRRGEDERYMAADLPMSEVYRSAFLRALAWAKDVGGVPEEVTDVLASETIPIDFDRWMVRPGRRPSWWPALADAAAPIDTQAAEVFYAVTALWERQQGATGQWGSDWYLAQASGQVSEGKTVYDLQLGMCFQKRLSAGTPTLAEVVQWYVEGQPAEQMTRDAPLLRFRGTIHPTQPSVRSKTFAGSSFLPVAARLDRSGAGLRWQWWRGLRGIWTPAGYLSRSKIDVQCEERGISFRSEGAEVARWFDWTEAVRERSSDIRHPATGQCLLVRRSLVDAVVAATSASLCWFAQLSGSYNERGYGEPTKFTLEHSDGVSNIVLST